MEFYGPGVVILLLKERLSSSNSVGPAATPSGQNGEQQCSLVWWGEDGGQSWGVIGYCWGK